MGVPNLRRVVTPTVVAFREDIDVVYVPSAKRALPLLLVKLFADSRDELRRVEVQMHLPHARNWSVRRSWFHRLLSAIGQTDHGRSRQNKPCLDEVSAIDAFVHDLVSRMYCVALVSVLCPCCRGHATFLQGISTHWVRVVLCICRRPRLILIVQSLRLLSRLRETRLAVSRLAREMRYRSEMKQCLWRTKTSTALRNSPCVALVFPQSR